MEGKALRFTYLLDPGYGWLDCYTPYKTLGKVGKTVIHLIRPCMDMDGKTGTVYEIV